MTPARWIDGPPPASGHVRRHRCHREQQPSCETDAGGRGDAEHERGEQRDVRPARREQMGETARAEVLADVVGERVVLPEHHPPAECRRAGGRALDSACSARRRTPSSAPATPPRRRPVGSSRSTEICAWAPRRRSYSSAGPSASIRPRTRTSVPVGDRGHRARTPPCDARRSTTRSPFASSAGATTVPHALRSGGSRTVAVICTWRPMSGVSVVPSIASIRACATSAPTASATTTPAPSTAAVGGPPRTQSASHGLAPATARAAAIAADRPAAGRRRPPAPAPRRALPSRRCRGWRRASSIHALTPSPGRAAPRGAPRRSRARRRAPRPSRSRRAARGRPGSSPPSPGRRPRACRAARASRC